jgi:hypothetical protein
MALDSTTALEAVSRGQERFSLIMYGNGGRRLSMAGVP